MSIIPWNCHNKDACLPICYGSRERTEANITNSCYGLKPIGTNMFQFSFEGGIMILTPVCTAANGSSQDTGSFRPRRKALLLPRPSTGTMRHENDRLPKSLTILFMQVPAIKNHDRKSINWAFGVYSTLKISQSEYNIPEY